MKTLIIAIIALCAVTAQADKLRVTWEIVNNAETTILSTATKTYNAKNSWRIIAAYGGTINAIKKGAMADISQRVMDAEKQPIRDALIKQHRESEEAIVAIEGE
jgi:hypothetical protein